MFRRRCLSIPAAGRHELHRPRGLQSPHSVWRSIKKTCEVFVLSFQCACLSASNPDETPWNGIIEARLLRIPQSSIPPSGLLAKPARKAARAGPD